MIQLSFQILVSLAAAILLDWGIQFQVKMMVGAKTTGERPTAYKIGPASKILAIIAYLIPMNIIISSQAVSFSILWILLIISVSIYVIYTSLLAIRSMQSQ